MAGVVAACALFASALIAAGMYFLSGVSLAADGSALARVSLQPLAGSLVSVRATAADGTSVPLAVRGDVLTPTRPVTPGEPVTVAVVVRRPGWASWALGSERREHLTIRTPVAHIEQRWLTVAEGTAAGGAVQHHRQQGVGRGENLHCSLGDGPDPLERRRAAPRRSPPLHVRGNGWVHVSA